MNIEVWGEMTWMDRQEGLCSETAEGGKAAAAAAEEA
jgi:hypothetical protein